MLDSPKTTAPPVKRHDRDEEDIYQDNKRAPGQHSSQLPSRGVRVIRVDDRYGDDEQPQDGSGRACACAEEALIVANHDTTLSTTANARRSFVHIISPYAGTSRMEPTGIEPVTSCLQIEGDDIWKDADLEDIYL